jgi:zinc protease
MEIQTVRSPGGIEAWLVEDHAVPIMALRFLFDGGSSQDPFGKEGLAYFVASILDQAGGDNTGSIQEWIDDLAIRMGFGVGRDFISGSLDVITENREEAAQLLKRALTQPHVDSDAIERTRQRIRIALANAPRDPFKMASAQWNALAFGDHSYGQSMLGNEASVSRTRPVDLASYCARIFAKDTLKAVVVGDITAAELGDLLDEVFGNLPAKAELYHVPRADIASGGRELIVEMDVSQSVLAFGLEAISHDDPDYIAACVLNHIVGGAGVASKLVEEVRSKRGLAYSVGTTLVPGRYASVFRGTVATRNDMVGESLDIIREELRKMAEGEISQSDLDSAKSSLVGSYLLHFDASAKIAVQLLALYREGVSPDYVDERNAMIAAVTLEDVKRVAKRLLNPDNLIVAIVGQPVLERAKAG